MSEMLLRKEVPEQYKWDPTHLYATQEAWEADFEWVKERMAQLSACAGTLHEGRAAVLKALRLYAETGEHFSRLYTYASISLNSDNSDAFYQGVLSRASSLYAQLMAAAAFLSPELLTLDSDVLQQYMAAPDFADFDTMLRDLERMRPYTLSTEMETVLAGAQEALQSPGNIYDMLTDVDMKLGKVKGEDGKLVELTHARYGSMMESLNRNVRKAAFERMMKAYAAYAPPLQRPMRAM